MMTLTPNRFAASAKLRVWYPSLLASRMSEGRSLEVIRLCRTSEKRVELRLRPHICRDGDELILSWLRTAVPRFGKVGDPVRGRFRCCGIRDRALSAQFICRAPDERKRIRARTPQPIPSIRQ